MQPMLFNRINCTYNQIDIKKYCNRWSMLRELGINTVYNYEAIY